MPSVAAGCYYRNSRLERAMRPDALGRSLRDLAEGQPLVGRSRGRIVDPTAIVIDSVSAASIGPIHVRSSEATEQITVVVARLGYQNRAVEFVALCEIAIEVSLADDQYNSAPTETTADVESSSNQKNAVPSCRRVQINRQIALDHLDHRAGCRSVARQAGSRASDNIRSGIRDGLREGLQTVHGLLGKGQGAHNVGDIGGSTPRTGITVFPATWYAANHGSRVIGKTDGIDGSLRSQSTSSWVPTRAVIAVQPKAVNVWRLVSIWRRSSAGHHQCRGKIQCQLAQRPSYGVLHH